MIIILINCTLNVMIIPNLFHLRTADGIILWIPWNVQSCEPVSRLVAWSGHAHTVTKLLTMICKFERAWHIQQLRRTSRSHRHIYTFT